MHGARLAVVSAVVIGGALLALGLIWFLRRPFELSVMSIEPSGIEDNTGRQLWLMTLAVTRPDVQFSRDSVKTEVRVGQRWMGVNQNEFLGPHDSGPRSKDTTEVLVLVPPDADGCRVHLNYQTELLKSRLVRSLGPRTRRALAKIPVIANWLWPKYTFPERFRQPPHWTPIILETTFSQQSLLAHVNSGQVSKP